MSDQTAPQSPEQKTAETPAPVFSINALPQLAGAVLTASRSADKTRSYTKEGFKGLSGLASLDNAQLSVMAGACMRQIALNGDDESGKVSDLLGNAQGINSRSGVIARFGPFIMDEASQEAKIAGYAAVIEDFKLVRNSDESATDFIKRIVSSYKGNAAKA